MNAPPMLPMARAVALAAENSENALPRSASRLRRDSSTSSGVMTSPPPTPVRLPARTRSGVVGARVSSTIGATGRHEPDEDERERPDPIGQPARRDPDEQDGQTVGDEEEPDVRARRLRSLGQEGDDDAPVRDEQQVDRDDRGPRPSEGQPETTPGHVGRSVVAGRVLTGRPEAERDDADDGDPGHDHDGRRQRHAMERTRGEDDEREGRDDDEGQVVGAPDEGQPEATSRRGDETRDERERGGQDGRDADPLADPGEDERRHRTTRFDAGQQQDRAPDEIGDRADAERSQAADAVDHDAGDEGGGDLHQRGRPDDQTDLGIRDTRPGERQGQRGREGMEPRLDGEDGDGKPEHSLIIEHGAHGGGVAGPGGPGPGGSAGRRGRPNLAGLAGNATLAGDAALPRIRGCTAAPVRRAPGRFSRWRSRAGPVASEVRRRGGCAASAYRSVPTRPVRAHRLPWSATRGRHGASGARDARDRSTPSR